MVSTSMIDDVNRKRPRENWISPFGWYPGKLDQVVAAYREAYPTGRRHVRLFALLVIGGMAFLLGAACLLWPA